MDDYDETTQEQTTQTPEPEDDLRAIISEQFKDDGDGADDVDEKGPAKEPAARDETGKFVAKEKDTPQPADKPKPAGEVSTPPVDKGQPAGEEGWKADKAPQSWTPKARERWNEIPADLRQEIVRREEASVAGVRQLQERYAPLTQFAEHLSPFINEALSSNVDPTSYIGNVLAAERGLRVGNDEQKFNALVTIADAYGIPLRRVLNEIAGSEVIPPAAPQLPPEVQRELMEARQFRQQYESQQRQQSGSVEISPELKDFASKNEFFEDVRLDMADLIESGVCPDLEAAYKEACWRNPGVRELMLERKAAEDKTKERQKKAAGAVSTGSNSAEVDVQTNKDEDDDDIYESVRKSVQSLNSRV